MFEDLLKLAKMSMENSYSPYSNFKVGAAIRCKDGSIFTGCNIENASYGATICAERTAIASAVASGHREFLEIAIVCSDKVMPYPCGICAQVMSEFSKDILIHVCNNANKIETLTLEELLPKGFKM